MSILNNAVKPTERRPTIITICGDSGTGKTTLAATFPKPIIMRTEGENLPFDSQTDAMVLPPLNNGAEANDVLRSLLTETHDYQTLVVDSVTGLDRLFEQDIIDSDPKKPKSINQALGGYGAGLAAVAKRHMDVRKNAGIVAERKNMNIVFIAHAQIETIEQPDQDPYSRYTMRLGKRSVAPYVDEVDCVGFIRLKTFTMGDGERKKAISHGERELVCYATASNISKNRYGITQPLEIAQNTNPLKEFLI